MQALVVTVETFRSFGVLDLTPFPNLGPWASRVKEAVGRDRYSKAMDEGTEELSGMFKESLAKAR